MVLAGQVNVHVNGQSFCGCLVKCGNLLCRAGHKALQTIIFGVFEIVQHIQFGNDLIPPAPWRFEWLTF